MFLSQQHEAARRALRVKFKSPLDNDITTLGTALQHHPTKFLWSLVKRGSNKDLSSVIQTHLTRHPADYKNLHWALSAISATTDSSLQQLAKKHYDSPPGKFSKSEKTAIRRLAAAAISKSITPPTNDEDPMVRSLQATRQTASQLKVSLTEEPWPFVRKAAAEASAKHCPTLAPDLELSAKKEQASDVRLASLISLSTCQLQTATRLATKAILEKKSHSRKRRYLLDYFSLSEEKNQQVFVNLVKQLRAQSYSSESTRLVLQKAIGILGKSTHHSANRILSAHARDITFPGAQAAALHALSTRCPQKAVAIARKQMGTVHREVTIAANRVLSRCLPK